MKRTWLATAVVCLVALPVTWYLGPQAYRRYREHRALAQAQAFASRQDWRNATLAARQALLQNPLNIQACEIIADMAEAAGAPQALEWRRRIAELTPTPTNQLRLVAAALAFEGSPWSLAQRTLREAEPAAGSIPLFHVLSADLALKRNQVEEAEAHFLEALRLEPTNRLHALNIAVLRLGSTNEAVFQKGWDALDRLAGDTNLAPQSLRSLVTASLSRTNAVAAEAYSKRLVLDPRCSLDDRLRNLSILKELHRPEFQADLAALKQTSLTNASILHGLSGWMLRNGLAADAFGWLTNLSPGMRKEQPARLALADCYAARGDWVGLEKWLENEKWQDYEFLRFAFLSRAAFEQGHDSRGDAQWRLAVHAAGSRIGPLRALVGLARTPIPAKAREDLLWRIVESFPSEQWAVRELEGVFVAAGDTRALRRLYSRLALLDSSDPMAKNNLAATSLLLQLDVARAHELARLNYDAQGTNPIVASTYAYSLHLQGRTGEGLAVFQKLGPEALNSPPVALYYGVLLAANGRAQEGKAYLAKASGVRLLPEEQALLVSAERSNPSADQQKRQ